MKKKYCHFCASPLIVKNYEGRERLFCENCQSPLYENPIPANAVVVLKDNNILLVKRNVEPKKGYWCLPGGFMELGEYPEEAALRELEEETGAIGEIDKLLGVTINHSDRYHTVLMIGYLVKKFSGNIEPGDDASDVRFFNSSNLPEIAFESHKKFINIVNFGR